MTSFSGEALHLAILAAPVSGSLAFSRSISFVSVLFVGHLGSAQLAAASLASSLISILGNSWMAACASAMATICGQAFGAMNHAGVGHAFQRSLVVQVATAIPILILLFNIQPLLLLAQQDPEIASMTSSYVRCLLPGVIFYGVNQSSQHYIQAQGIMWPVFYANVVVGSLHPLLNWLVIHYFGWQFLGAAVATTTSNFLQMVLLLAGVWAAKIHVKTWKGWSTACLQHWGPFLRLSFSSLLMMSEWWASEIVVFMAGILPESTQSLAAMACYNSINSLSGMLPAGLGLAVLTRVSNELGAGSPDCARHSARVALWMGLVTTALTSAVIFIDRTALARMYTQDAQLLAPLSWALATSAAYVVVDGLQVILGGVIRGAHRQAAAVPIVMGSYYPLALPLGAALAFKCNLGVHGLCLGMLVGTAAHAGLFWVLYAFFNWELEAQRAMQRVGLSLSVAPPTPPAMGRPVGPAGAKAVFTLHDGRGKRGMAACEAAQVPLLSAASDGPCDDSSHQSAPALGVLCNSQADASLGRHCVAGEDSQHGTRSAARS